MSACLINQSLSLASYPSQVHGVLLVVESNVGDRRNLLYLPGALSWNLLYLHR
jgi:hypothetical protein